MRASASSPISRRRTMCVSMPGEQWRARPATADLGTENIAPVRCERTRLLAPIDTGPGPRPRSLRSRCDRAPESGCPPRVMRPRRRHLSRRADASAGREPAWQSAGSIWTACMPKAAGRPVGADADVGGEAGVAGGFQVRLASTSLVSVALQRAVYWTTMSAGRRRCGRRHRPAVRCGAPPSHRTIASFSRSEERVGRPEGRVAATVIVLPAGHSSCLPAELGVGDGAGARRPRQGGP